MNKTLQKETGLEYLSTMRLEELWMEALMRTEHAHGDTQTLDLIDAELRRRTS